MISFTGNFFLNLSQKLRLFRYYWERVTLTKIFELLISLVNSNPGRLVANMIPKLKTVVYSLSCKQKNQKQFVILHKRLVFNFVYRQVFHQNDYFLDYSIKISEYMPILGLCVDAFSAWNYRPCFRENQPKRSFSIKWKRAFWACFRENWVYKFGHRAAYS
jgi:hypothetical protein